MYRPVKQLTPGGKETDNQPLQADYNEHSSDGEHSNNDNVWKTEAETEDSYNKDYKGKEKGAKYVKDSTTGLWMVPVSEETCKADQGFVCKVSGATWWPNLQLMR